jgi:5-dehydro-2-deoxygluconokinase
LGRNALFRASENGLWIGRPVEEPGSVPLSFEHGSDLGSQLIEWPVDHVAKCLCFYHPDDPAELRAAQDQTLLQLQQAALLVGREFLVEIISSRSGPVGDDTVARVMAHLYGLGVRPDWWKLEPQASPAAWSAIETVIRNNDPACRGIVILGLEAEEAVLAAAFEAAATCRMVKGFAVGRTIFNAAARAWLRDGRRDGGGGHGGAVRPAGDAVGCVPPRLAEWPRHLGPAALSLWSSLQLSRGRGRRGSRRR